MRENVCKRCRRAGTKLFLKGEKCIGPKCAVSRRDYPPGMHGQTRRRSSEYGLQLREKQKAADIFFINEEQLNRYYKKAVQTKGSTGEVLMQLLERRLDNIVYRLGFAAARAQAKQIVSHGLVVVNGKKVNLPSYSVEAGDKIAVSESAQKNKFFMQRKEEMSKINTVPGWLKLDPKNFEGEVLSLPTRDQMESLIDESLIVEFYSR